jgi:hypothetical protein
MKTYLLVIIHPLPTVKLDFCEKCSGIKTLAFPNPLVNE